MDGVCLRRHIGDALDPFIDIGTHRFSVQTYLDGAVGQRPQQQIAFGISLDAHRGACL